MHFKSVTTWQNHNNSTDRLFYHRWFTSLPYGPPKSVFRTVSVLLDLRTYTLVLYVIKIYKIYMILYCMYVHYTVYCSKVLYCICDDCHHQSIKIINFTKNEETGHKPALQTSTVMVLHRHGQCPCLCSTMTVLVVLVVHGTGQWYVRTVQCTYCTFMLYTVLYSSTA